MTTPYERTLAELWRAHLAPRAPDAPGMVSLFSGCGGSSLGYSAAGYRELLAAEWDAKASAVFRANFPGVPVHEGDIAELDPGALGLAPGELYLLDSSPPCQGFSETGLRRAADPRSQLWRQVVRLADAWRPKVVVIENVAGLVHGPMRPVFSAICSALTDLGYVTEARLIDCSQLGVPQARKRVLIVGARSDAGARPAFPRPFTRPRTVRDAWAGLGGPGEYLGLTGHVARLAPLIEPGKRGLDALEQRGGRSSWWNLRRVAWDKPSPTLVRNTRTSKEGLLNGGGYLHPDSDRTLGTRELARLQSFPDEFDFCGLGYVTIHNQVGNSVPPLMARAAGLALLDAFS